MKHRYGVKCSSILPLGKINLKIGKSKYFNVYETWEEGTTYELYSCPDINGVCKLKLVATAGTSPLASKGQRRRFDHDQTGRFLFEGTMIDFAVGSQLKSFAEKYKVTSISGYTYK